MVEMERRAVWILDRLGSTPTQGFHPITDIEFMARSIVQVAQEAREKALGEFKLLEKPLDILMQWIEDEKGHPYICDGEKPINKPCNCFVGDVKAIREKLKETP